MIDVMVATHKKVNIDLPGYCRLIQVGSSYHSKIKGYLHDDWDGSDNISDKNESYCELTALYCLWRHSDADIKGLYHYRRYFYSGRPMNCNLVKIKKRTKDIKKYCITEEEIIRYLQDFDVIVEIPYNPAFKNAEEDLQRFCFRDDIEKFRSVIQNYYPQYREDFEAIMKSYHLSYCNMLISKREIMNDYCNWLFEVLSKCESIININHCDQEHKRIFGYFAEVLMNVYIRHNHLRQKQLPVMIAFEYSTKMRYMKWIEWYKENTLTILEKKGIRLPTSGTKIINAYNEWLQRGENVTLM